MSKRLEQAKTRAANIIAVAESEQFIREALPEVANMDEPTIHFASRPEPWIVYRCANVHKVRATLDAFKPWVQCATGNARGIRYTGPLEYVASKVKDSMVEPYLVRLDVSGGQGYGPDAEFVVHSHFPLINREFRVVAKLTSRSGYGERPVSYPGPLHVASSVIYGRYGNVTLASYNWLGDLKITKWAAVSPDSYRFSSYWTSAESFASTIKKLAQS